MDATQYYVTTLTNAAIKLGPLVFYLLAGYFLFIKLPFLLYYRSIQKNKGTAAEFTQQENVDADFQKKMEEERKREFEERMKNLGGDKNKEERKKQSESNHSKSQKSNDKQRGSQQKRQQKEEKQRTSEQIKATPEEILFKLKPGQVFTAQELKKIYHKLLKENHPDKFRTDHQKEFAESKTKSINDAYQKLKKRVS